MLYLIILAFGLLGNPFGSAETRGDSIETRDATSVPGQVIIRFQSEVTQRLRAVDAKDVQWLERRYSSFDTAAQELGIEFIRPVSDELQAASGPVAAKLDDFFVARVQDEIV